MEPIPTLKLVSAWSPDRHLRAMIEEVLRAHVPAEDIRHLHGRVYLVYTAAEPAEIRDWLASHLVDGERAFVVEFERWSGRNIPHRDWLLVRGH